MIETDGDELIWCSIWLGLKSREFLKSLLKSDNSFIETISKN